MEQTIAYTIEADPMQKYGPRCHLSLMAYSKRSGPIPVSIRNPNPAP